MEQSRVLFYSRWIFLWHAPYINAYNYRVYGDWFWKRNPRPYILFFFFSTICINTKWSWINFQLDTSCVLIVTDWRRSKFTCYFIRGILPDRNFNFSIDTSDASHEIHNVYEIYAQETYAGNPKMTTVRSRNQISNIKMISGNSVRHSNTRNRFLKISYY